MMQPGARIVNMASCVYCLGHLDFPAFFEKGRKGSFWRIPVYSNTKLAITLFTLDLARRVKEKGITVAILKQRSPSCGPRHREYEYDYNANVFRPHHRPRVPPVHTHTTARGRHGYPAASQQGQGRPDRHIQPFRQKHTPEQQIYTPSQDERVVVADRGNRKTLHGRVKKEYHA